VVARRQVDGACTRENVYVFPTERPHELVIRIPLSVHDLDWTEAAVVGLP